MSEIVRKPVLETKHLGISFGGLHAVQDFNLSIYSGELVQIDRRWRRRFILIMVQPLSWIWWITTSSTVNIFFLEKMVPLLTMLATQFCNMCGDNSG